jgi:arylsulfatase A
MLDKKNYKLTKIFKMKNTYLIYYGLTYLIYYGLTCFFILCSSGFSIQAQKRQNPPNIIFILVDDMGYGDAKSFNSESKISTPNIDKLAASGMMFTDAHASASSCIPSRYGLLTGTYPFRAKHFNWRTEPLIDENRTTIASLLQKSGYHTGMVGKWHLGFDYSDYSNLTGGPVDRGFDYYYGISRSLDQKDYYYIEDQHAVEPPTEDIAASEGYGKNGWQGAFWRAGKAAKNFKHEEVLNTFTQKSIDFIEEAADDSNPFFLYLALASPHTPWLPSQQFQGTSEIGDWGDWVAENDHSIGKVLQAVYDMGLRENTLIIFTSDNGPVWWPVDIEKYGHRSTSIYRGMKFDAYEGGHRMPFIASWPGVIEQGSQSDRIVSNTDMLATFADLLGEQLPEDAGEDSYSIADTFYKKEATNPIREVIVGRPDNTDLYIRKGDWKLIGTDQLYNLDKDPSEKTNVYNDNKDIATELLSLLEKYKTDGRSTPAP